MKIRTNYTFNSHSLSLCVRASPKFRNVASARWGFTAQMVWWYCAFVHIWREHTRLHYYYINISGLQLFACGDYHSDLLLQGTI